MNFERYPWLLDLSSSEAINAIRIAKKQYKETGAATFSNFITNDSLVKCVDEAKAKEDTAFITDDVHTPYQLPVDTINYPSNSVRNHLLQTKVASIAYDELCTETSELRKIYNHPILLKLVSLIVLDNDDNEDDDDTTTTANNNEQSYLSEDKLGCCSINVFKPNWYHSFHFDESEFTTSIMLQESQVTGTGLFQYTYPLRSHPSSSSSTHDANSSNNKRSDNDDDDDINNNNDNLVRKSVATILKEYDDTIKENHIQFWELLKDNQDYSQDENLALAQQQQQQQQEHREQVVVPKLYTLDFKPGTLSIFSGSISFHRVTTIKGNCSRLTAILTFSKTKGFKNSSTVQEMFWGRSLQ